MIDTSQLSAIDEALGVAAPRLDPSGQRVAVATYRTLAEGRPAPTARIARAAGVEVAAVEQMLDGWSAVYRDDRGCVVGFWGLAVEPMPHRLRIADRDLYAWCAWDPFFLARIVGPMTVATDDPETAETISYRLDADGVVEELSHPDSVLSFLRPSREWDDGVMASFCHYVVHFTGPESAQRWTARHDGTFVLDLSAAADLARRHVERAFGDALR